MASLVEAAGAAFVTSTTNTVTTGSYTPVLGSLQVALVAVGNGNGIGTTSETLTDTSGSGTWTQISAVLTANAGRAYIYARSAWSGAATVTFTSLPTTVIDCSIQVQQFSGAAPAAYQPGATATLANTSSQNLSITPKYTGSQCVGAFGTSAGAKVLTANATTTIYSQTDAGVAGDTEALIKASSLSVAGTAISMGFTNTAALNSFALAEIIPLTSLNVAQLNQALNAASQW